MSSGNMLENLEVVSVFKKLEDFIQEYNTTVDTEIEEVIEKLNTLDGLHIDGQEISARLESLLSDMEEFVKGVDELLEEK